MNRSLLPALLPALLLALAACSKEDSNPVPPAPEKKARPEKIANGEPAAITVKHVLISFAGTPRTRATRTKEEAERLAYEVLAKAKKGDDFDALMKAHSDDPGPGTYGMANAGVEPEGEESPRSGMVRAFGDVGFRIEVGEVGFASHDPETSPFGYHVIKRVK
jgi:parvulin-like peptidyl-prolyl isomerase